MNIKRVIEKDTRTAFETIKGLYGEDTVILSNKKIGDQVELVVAIELDDGSYNLEDDPKSGVDRAGSEKARKVHDQADAKGAPTVEWMKARSKAESRSSLAKSKAVTEKESIEQVKSLLKETRKSVSAMQPDDAADPQAAAGDVDLQKIHSEMSELRDMFQTHLNISARNYRESLSIEAKAVIQKLEIAGVSSAHIEKIQRESLASGRKRDFRKKSLLWLKERINYSNVDPVRDGGIFSLVGLTGVGKTTAIAKIASQAALLHGKHQVGLITLDHNRIGSKEQMRLFGMMLGVEVAHVSNTSELKSNIAKFKDKKLVLIDTAGTSIRADSQRVLCQALRLGHDEMKIILAISASSQSEVNTRICTELRNTVNGTIVTKLDESVSYGGVLSTLIDTGLGLIGSCDGHEVPQTYRPITPSELVDRCFEVDAVKSVDQPKPRRSSAA